MSEKFRSHKTVIAATIALLTCVLLTLPSTQHTSAASLTNFDPGNIMSDTVMDNSSAMNLSQIQAFLTSKNTCLTSPKDPSVLTSHTDTLGTLVTSTMTYYYYLKNGQFVCLADQDFNGKSAAQIIYNASQQYHINPQVLIVLLQKEQGLITDNWPNYNHQYAEATGYMCPDTPTGCNAAYAGFENQMNYAAALFHSVLTGGPSNYPIGINYILYSPATGCGGSNVNVKNLATSALYRYTPYQPDQSALNAGYGNGDACSAYGNRNFYLYFTDWFGSTIITFQSLSDPRYLQLSADTQKINAYTGELVGSALPTGTQRFFPDKVVSLDGDQCVRTQSDKDQGNPYCIPLKDTTTLKPIYTQLTQTDGTMEATAPIYKVDMARPSDNISGPYPLTWQRSFVAKTTIDSTTYYVTDVDYNNGTLGGFISTSLATSPIYQKIDPTWFVLSQDSSKYEPLNNSSIGPVYSSGLTRIFTSRTSINGTWYYRTESDDNRTLSQGFPFTAMDNLPYTQFSSPRWMYINKNSHQYTPSTGLQSGSEVTQGTQFKFTSKILVANKLYYRTDANTASGTDTAFLASDVSDIQFENFSDPRQLTLTQDSHKVFPIIGTQSSNTFPTGMIRKFTTKVYVDGQWYFRTNADTTFGIPQTFPASVLRDI